MNDSFLNSANAPYVAELFFKFKEDPNSIDKSWSNFFETFHEDDLAILSDFGGPEWKKRTSNVIDNVSFDKVIRSIGNIDENNFVMKSQNILLVTISYFTLVWQTTNL